MCKSCPYSKKTFRGLNVKEEIALIEERIANGSLPMTAHACHELQEDHIPECEKNVCPGSARHINQLRLRNV